MSFHLQNSGRITLPVFIRIHSDQLYPSYTVNLGKHFCIQNRFLKKCQGSAYGTGFNRFLKGWDLELRVLKRGLMGTSG